MARYDHLRLLRLPQLLERRKVGGGRAPDRDIPRHARRLRDELSTVVEAQRRRRRPEAVDPSLILRVQMSGGLLEQDWERLGLTVLSTDPDRTLVLFADTDEMVAFRERLDAFERGIPEGRQGPAFAAFIGGIERISDVEPRDRIGARLREEGFTVPEDFAAAESYLLDLELWDLGRRERRVRALDQITGYIEARGGEVLDTYVGPAITMARVRIMGALATALLTLPDVASLDRPPQPDLELAEVLDLTLPQTPPLVEPDPDLPVIGIIDSGLNAHPLIEDIILGSIAVPETLGVADVWGHGTRVAGVAAFGDLRAQLDAGELVRVGRLCSARVVNDNGGFDDRRLVPSQMREAITRLREAYGCRIFVSALADTRRIHTGGKVGSWAATLDELARELDVLILVAAGNRTPRYGPRLDQGVTEYPDYLLEPENGLFEPAGALNVLTVGALAHGEGLDAERADDVRSRPITIAGEPSPFTRSGPGVQGATKPDLVDTGGTMIVDPLVMRMRSGADLASCGVVTLNHRFIDRLFTAQSGTSYAAPLVASKAAQILRRFPTASANLLRALLVGSAAHDAAAAARLNPLGPGALRRVCGHGRVDTERAAFSDDDRVVFYAEDRLAVDHFAIYEVPVPEIFQSGGRRTLQVTLAYDPPVRHTRLDYAGVGMSFRLHRGVEPAVLFEHYRRRTADEGRQPEIAGRFSCQLEPGPTEREKGSVQVARRTFVKDSDYPDPFYLVVRCEGGWAADAVLDQRFAVVVELAHEAETRLYERLRGRVRLTV